MKFSIKQLLCVAAFVSLAAVPAVAQTTTVRGKVAGLNFAQKTFWINGPGGRSYKVMARGADIELYGTRPANIYRMFGGPYVRVTGWIGGRTLHATEIDITSGPTERLESSSYTRMAEPPFAWSQIVHH